MKRTTIFFLAILAFAGCNQEPGTFTTTTAGDSSTTTTLGGGTTTTTTTVNPISTNLVAAASITAANFTSYSVDLAANEYRIFIISNYNEAIDTSDDWEKDAIVYEVFIRSFKDSGSDGCGDLDGLTSKLAYITNIGFTAVWTTPIFASPSTHGYDITNYNTIAVDLGTMSDFNDYVAAAHAKGLKVILDMVLNHTGSGHTRFQQFRTLRAIRTIIADELYAVDCAARGAEEQFSVWLANSGSRGGLYFYSAFN
jgi:hypothetical protein